MAKEKALATQIKEANATIKELKDKLSNCESVKKMYQDKAEKAELEIDSVHCALDAMFVPRMVKTGYSEKSMTIASRLFAWQAGARIEPTSKREVE